MLWLAVHFPRLPLEIFTAGQHDPAQVFIVLQDNRVAFLNEAARQSGIVPGATLATAHSIQPQLEHRHRDPAAELQRLRGLADTLYRFSGYVSLQAPDCVLLEIGGSLKLFHSHQNLAQAALAVCRALGHDATARVANTPWAAIALARAACRQLADVPLADAGLELAGVKTDVVERFANMGIYTLGPLLNLPSKSLGKRFGKPLLQYLAQLTGDLPDPREALTPSRRFQQALHLLSPLRDKQALHDPSKSPMQQLAGELEHWLIAHQLGCEALTWRFSSHSSQQQASMLVRFARAKQSAADIMRISELRMEQLELPEEVLSIELCANRLQPWAGRSHSLFQLAGAPGASDDLSTLVDEFNARLGEGLCCRIEAATQHTPEHAWRAHGTRSASSAGHSRQPALQSHAHEAAYLQQLHRRPLWLFDPPRRVSSAELELLQGPERIQTHWWQGEATSRDYYIAQHRSGAECWAFVDHKADWYLHGYFG